MIIGTTLGTLVEIVFFSWIAGIATTVGIIFVFSKKKR